jgi:RHS repeat-associated protein
MPPVFDGGLAGWAGEFETRVHNACYINMIDSGWGQTVSSYNCWTGGPKTLNGILVNDFRTFAFTGRSPDALGNCTQPWAELVRASRGRTINCPAAYETRSKPGGAPGELECWKIPVSCDDSVGGSGAGSGTDSVGNPIRLADCAKIQREVDIAPIGNGGLQFVRIFTSGGYFEPDGGPSEGTWSYWRHTYARRIVALDGNTAAMAVAQREDGDLRYFDTAGSERFNADGAAAQLQRIVDGGGTLTGWRYTTQDVEVELYNAAGQLLSVATPDGLVQTLAYSDGSTPASVAGQPGLLISVSDAFGRTLRLTYDSLAGLSTVTDPAGNVYRYQYDSGRRLSQVTYPDQTQRTYVYENAAFPFLLTGIVDENGKRFATYTYDAAGHAESTQHAAGAGLYRLRISTTTSPPARTVTVTDSQGRVFNNDYSVAGGTFRRSRRYCSNCDGAMQEDFTFDANGNRASYTDANRNRTNFTFDPARNLEAVRVEGLTAAGGTTSATRTITTQWHPIHRLRARVAEPTRITTYTYDSAGNVLAKSIQATTDPTGSQGFAAAAQGPPRVWAYTYGSYGRVLTIDGPRSDAGDITTYMYYPDTAACMGCRGQIQTIANPLNQLTTFGSYDANGRPAQIIDSNGVVTALAYHPRGWLASRIVNAGQAGAEKTAYGYDNAGQLTKVTLADGSWIGYQYDDAHRLTEIADSAGNVVQYTLDPTGNRVKEEVYDPQDSLRRTQSSVYDSLNRLLRTIGGADPAREVTQYGYDSLGNMLTTLDALGRSSTQQYDARSRLIQMTDAANGVTAYAYDGLDRLLRVTDPRGLGTQYTYNGLGDLTQLSSPDTGTAQYTYDDSGNVRTKIDARGQLTTIAYDVLNRVTSKASANGPTVTFTYDQGAFGVGRLSALNDGAALTQWTYDAFGRVGTKTQSLHGRSLTIGYGYAMGGKVNRIAYPSGRVVTYAYDSAGRPVSVSVDGASLLSVATYEPFGQANGWLWSNGTRHQRSYDRNGRVTALTFPVETADQQSFGYDLLDRLVSATLAGSNVSLAYSYDATGNRTSEARNGAASQYVTGSASNRLQGIGGATTRSMSYNASGSLASDRGITFSYDGRERLISAGSTSYYVSGLDQRIEKAGPGAGTASGVRQFVYDEQGRLLGEYDGGSGAPIAEHIYFGDWPVGLMRGGTIYHVHPDQLGAPRVVARPTDNQTMWAWKREPFGSGVVEAASGFEYNLRFPGQYYDAETGLHYNYFRDYDPSVGRYVESDPIGLKGGANTYAYAVGRPIAESDATGLAVWQCFRSMAWVPVGNHTYFFDDKTSRCCGNPGWGPDVRHPLAKCKEGGPGKDTCLYISSSDSDTEKLLKCCDERSNPWKYFPGARDCQNTTDDCIRSIGMTPTATPNENRYRVCDSCRQTPNNPSPPPQI